MDSWLHFNVLLPRTSVNHPQSSLPPVSIPCDAPPQNTFPSALLSSSGLSCLLFQCCFHRRTTSEANMSYSLSSFCLLVICSPNENVISLFVSVCVYGRKVFDLLRSPACQSVWLVKQSTERICVPDCGRLRPLYIINRLNLVQDQIFCFFRTSPQKEASGLFRVKATIHQRREKGRVERLMSEEVWKKKWGRWDGQTCGEMERFADGTEEETESRGRQRDEEEKTDIAILGRWARR